MNVSDLCDLLTFPTVKLPTFVFVTQRHALRNSPDYLLLFRRHDFLTSLRAFHQCGKPD